MGEVTVKKDRRRLTPAWPLFAARKASDSDELCRHAAFPLMLACSIDLACRRILPGRMFFDVPTAPNGNGRITCLCISMNRMAENN